MAQLLEPFAGRKSLELATIIRREFGSLSRAMAAPAAQFRQVAAGFGHSAEMLLAAKRLIESSERELPVGTPVRTDDPAMIRYIRDRLCHGTVETLLVIFCDKQQRYLHDETMGWGTSDSIRLDPSHLFRRALKVDAHSVLMAHNHPSGDCRPSENDIHGTRRLAQSGLTLNIHFIDHLVVTPLSAWSMRSNAKL